MRDNTGVSTPEFSRVDERYYSSPRRMRRTAVARGVIIGDVNAATRRLASVVGGTAVAILAAVATPSMVLADCDGSVLPFREFAPTAERIVIGEVVAVDPGAPWVDAEGRSSRFTLRVEHVLRGPAADVLPLRDLAFLQCADHIILARKGDRIALAERASNPLLDFKFDTVAWIKGTPWRDDVERISVAEAFSLIGLPLPETSTGSAGSSSTGEELFSALAM
jgi:hypothetical protein